MSRFVVSFCNSGQARVGLITEGGLERVVEIDVSSLPSPVGGTTGIAVRGDEIVVGLQSATSAVAVLGPDLSTRGVRPLSGVRDVHGLAFDGDRLLAVSTGDDRVVACDPATGAALDVRYDHGTGSDTLHINDITSLGGEPVCCGFGAVEADTLRSGGFLHLATGRLQKAGLQMPHSVTAREDSLLVLESGTGILYRFRGGEAPERVCTVLGYARGLAVTSTHYLIGKSGYRAQSRSVPSLVRLLPLLPYEAADQGLFGSGVYVVERDSLACTFIETATAGDEIYGIAELPGA